MNIDRNSFSTTIALIQEKLGKALTTTAPLDSMVDNNYPPVLMARTQVA
jgi:hypothetical protein